MARTPGAPRPEAGTEADTESGRKQRVRRTATTRRMQSPRKIWMVAAAALLWCAQSLSAQPDICPAATTQGRDFWVMFLYNQDGGADGELFKLSLYAAGEDDAAISVGNPQSGYRASMHLAGGREVLLTVPSAFGNAYAMGSVQDIGLHVTSTSNISLYASNYKSKSFDISTILPTKSLRTRYIVQDYPGDGSQGAEIGVLAVEDNTHVVVVMSAATTSGQAAGQAVRLTLDAGQACQWETAAAGSHSFSGTEVRSDKPVAVFQGNRCAKVQCEACDHLYEQAVPTLYWGKEFILVPIAGRSSGDQVRVTAAENPCDLYLDGRRLTTLQPRQTHEFLLPNGTARRLTSTMPVSVCLYMAGGQNNRNQGDPSSVVIPPAEQGVCRSVFNAMAFSINTRHYINVVTRTRHVEGMTLDGTGIAAHFTALDTAYSYAQLPVLPGTHTLNNDRGIFSAFFYGLDEWESYAYTAGMGLHNLRGDLLIDGVESASINGHATACLLDTVHLAVRTHNPDSSVQWFIDGLPLATRAASLRHRFPSTGSHSILAVTHGLCDTDWCDSLRLTVDVVTPYEGDSAVVLCATACTFGQSVLTASGHYSLSLPGVGSCDSLVHLDLTLYSNGTSEAAATVCDSRRWKGRTLTQPGTYTFDTLTTRGCDSTLQLRLDIAPPLHRAFRRTACDSYAWIDGDGGTYTASTTRTHSHPDANGCTQVDTLHLTIHHSNTGDTTAHGCDRFSWHGYTYTGSGDFGSTFPVPNSHGCDSTTVLHLTISHSSSSTYRDTVVENSLPRWFNGRLFADSTSHATVTLTNASACDSIIHYSLFVYRNDHVRLDSAVCGSRLPIVWNGITYDTNILNLASFAYTDTVAFTNRHGADSIVYMRLAVHPDYDLRVSDTIYDGDSYSFGHQRYDTTGVYPLRLASSHGCDSLLTLHLQRNRRTYADSLVCLNHLPLTWNGRVFSPQGLYINGHGLQAASDSVHLRGMGGIDSLVVMTLLIRDTSASVDEVHACDSFVWPLTPGGVYRSSSFSAQRRLAQQSPPDTASLHTLFRHGSYAPFTRHLTPYTRRCDSVCHLHLTVDSTRYATDFCIACDSLIWPTHAASLTARRLWTRDTVGSAGNLGSRAASGPVDTLRSAAGCDSVVCLNLAIRHSTRQESVDTFCSAQTYTWRHFTCPPSPLDEHTAHTTEDYLLADTLTCHPFRHPARPSLSVSCDSIHVLRLTRMALPSLQQNIVADCHNRRYDIRASIATDPGRSGSLMPHIRWQMPPGILVAGEETDSCISIEPRSGTVLYATADYRPAGEPPLCPLSDTLRLHPVAIPAATIKAVPEYLQYGSLEAGIYDIGNTRASAVSPDSAGSLVRRWRYRHNNDADWTLSPHTGSHLTIPASPSADTLRVALTVFNGQCADSAVVAIPILRTALFAPNAFTPGAESNNHFAIEGHGILAGELAIYSRKGLLVHRSADYTAGWDGRRADGTPCPQGSYVWRLDYRSIDAPASIRSATGTVFLLR